MQTGPTKPVRPTGTEGGGGVRRTHPRFTHPLLLLVSAKMKQRPGAGTHQRGHRHTQWRVQAHTIGWCGQTPSGGAGTHSLEEHADTFRQYHGAPSVVTQDPNGVVVAVAPQGGWGSGQEGREGGGSRGTPTYIYQNDQCVALIILTHVCWGKRLAKLFHHPEGGWPKQRRDSAGAL